MADKTIQASGSPFGCFALIITLFALWATIFGVAIRGQHYGLSCTCARGVVVDGLAQQATK